MATLTINYNEQCVIGGTDHNHFVSKAITGIEQHYSQSVEVLHTGEQTLLNIDTTSGPGQLIGTDIKYLRITNRSTANFITLNFVFDDSTDSAYQVKVDKGMSYLVSVDLDGARPGFDATDGGLAMSLAGSHHNLESIRAQADTATCLVDIDAFLS